MKKFTDYFSRYLLEHGVEPRKLTEKEREQWEHTAQDTELFLQYYEQLQEQGSNGQDLYESPELLEVLHEMENNQALMEKESLGAAETDQAAEEKKSLSAVGMDRMPVEKKEGAETGSQRDFVQISRKTGVMG